MIKLENFSKIYKKDKGIKDINITFEVGNIYALVGPNGSGKTTLLNSITGFTKGKGSIIVFGETKRDLFLKEISYMPDEEFLSGASIKNIGEVTNILEPSFDINTFYNYIEQFGLNKKDVYLRLSKGQKMCVKVGFTLSRQTKAYLFDEPLSGIDIITRDTIVKEIMNKSSDDTLIIISSHELHDLDNRIDTVVFLNEGHIVEITPLDTLKDEFGKDLSDIYLSKFNNV